MNPVHLFTLTTLLFAQGIEAAPWLVERGQAQAEIVVAEEPTRSARLGATELQTYLQKISGAKLDIVTSPTDANPIKIYVGESEASRQAGVTPEGLERDAFRIVSGPDWLALVGNDLDFQPREPWARNHNDWARKRHNPIGTRLYRDYSKQLDIWLSSGKGTSLPWFFNAYRKRAGSEAEETTAFSPLGPEETSFHVPLKFGQIYVR